MKKFTKRCLWVISLLILLCSCNTSTLSTMKTSVGPSSPGGYFLQVRAIPDVQQKGLTSSIYVRVLDSGGTGASDVTVNFLGSVSKTTDTTDSSGNVTVSLTVAEGTNNVIVQLEDIGTSVSVLGVP